MCYVGAASLFGCSVMLNHCTSLQNCFVPLFDCDCLLVVGCSISQKPLLYFRLDLNQTIKWQVNKKQTWFGGGLCSSVFIIIIIIFLISLPYYGYFSLSFTVYMSSFFLISGHNRQKHYFSWWEILAETCWKISSQVASYLSHFIYSYYYILFSIIITLM